MTISLHYLCSTVLYENDVVVTILKCMESNSKIFTYFDNDEFASSTGKIYIEYFVFVANGIVVFNAVAPGRKQVVRDIMIMMMF